MNSIAQQIDYATDILRATNDLLEARAEYRKAQEYGNIHKVIDAQVKVIKAELALKELYPPDEDLSQPPVGEIVDSVTTDSTVPYDCGETFPRVSRQRMNPDDPRRGQADGINAMIRRV